MVICPRCNQGWVAIERNFEKTIYICDECESMWLDKNNISKEIAIYFPEYIQNLGLDYHEISGKLYEIFKNSGFKTEYLE